MLLDFVNLVGLLVKIESNEIFTTNVKKRSMLSWGKDMAFCNQKPLKLKDLSMMMHDNIKCLNPVERIQWGHVYTVSQPDKES